MVMLVWYPIRGHNIPGAQQGTTQFLATAKSANRRETMQIPKRLHNRDAWWITTGELFGGLGV